MDVFSEDIAAHRKEITAAYKGDEAMRRKHPHWESQYQQLRQLFMN